MGAQFAQLVKELRSEYGGAVQACAFRISQVSACQRVLPCKRPTAGILMRYCDEVLYEPEHSI